MLATIQSYRRRVTSGAGVLAELPGELRAWGIRRAVLVTGPHVLTGGAGSTVVAAAGDAVAGTFTRCAANAPLDRVEELVSFSRDVDADGFISLGGGSAHDMAKGAVVRLATDRPLTDYATRFVPPDRLDVPLLDGDRLPIIAIPTTFSAAEATASAGFLDRSGRHKAVIVDRSAPVRSVLLDPQLAAHTPRAVLAASAGNALDHCVEAICSRGHTALTDAYAVSALRMISGAIVAALDGDVEALESCLVGTYLSGLALPPGGLGVNHAVCHALGAFGAAHGDANAAMLVHGMRFNDGWTDGRERLIEQAIDAPPGLAPEVLAKLLEGIGAPTALRHIGVSKDQLALIADAAMHDRHLYANPRPVRDPGELEDLLREAW